MSFFGNFVGGMANAGAGLLNAQIKSEAEEKQRKSMADYEADLQMKKQRALEEMRLESMPKELAMRTEAANAGLNQYGLILSNAANKEVPLEAKPVTMADGSVEKQNFSTDAPIHSNMSGTYEKALKLADGITDPSEKQSYLKALQEQKDRQTAEAQAEVVGKTRKVTQDEAEEIAKQTAMRTNPAAYADYQTRIAKPLRDERRLDQADDRGTRMEDRDIAATTDRNKRMDWQQEFQTRQLEQQKTLQELQFTRQSTSETNADNRARQAALNKIADDQSRDIKELRVRLADPMLDEGMKKLYTAQMQEAMFTHSQAIKQLSGIGGIDANKDAPQLQDVKVNGKVVGQASTPAEAAKVIDAWKAQAKPSNTSPEKPSVAQSSDASTDAPPQAAPKPFTPSAELEKKLQQENMAMGAGDIVRYSPDVGAYAKAKAQAEKEQLAERNRKRSEEEAKKAIERRKALGY